MHQRPRHGGIGTSWAKKWSRWPPRWIGSLGVRGRKARRRLADRLLTASDSLASVSSCTFCRILEGQVAASRVHEDDRTLAFLDVAPFSTGHTLVVPKTHEPSFRRLADADAAAVWQTARRVARAMERALPECHGVTFLGADGEAAGQEVPHAHLQVVPRRAGDGLGFRLPPNHGADEHRSVLDSVAREIKSAIKG